MANEYMQTFYHGTESQKGLCSYRCKVCGHELVKSDFNYCPNCGVNLKTGKLPLNLYVEGFRNGLTSAKLLREEGENNG